MNCIINDNDLANISVNSDRNVLLAKLWSSQNPSYKLVGNAFTNGEDSIPVSDVLDKMKKDYKGEKKPILLQKLNEELNKLLGAAEEDELPINENMTYIANDDLYNELTGKHADIGTSFIEVISDFLNEDELKEFNHNTSEWISIYENIGSLPYTQQKKYIDLMKSISNRLGLNQTVTPLQPLDDILFKMKSSDFKVKSLNFAEFINNSEEIINNEKKSFIDYVKTPFRKFMFTFLLNNLRYKFGVDYKWVKNVPFKARLYNGVVEINQDLFTDDDPFHEYLHAIILTLKQDNPDIYNQLLSIPEIDALAKELSRNSTYASYADEEAIVRVLSQPFVKVSYGTLFKQFLQWLKNLFSKLFNTKVAINLDMSVNNISNILLNSNKYLLNTNYFKNLERYDTDNFELFKALNTNLTPEQQSIIEKLEENNSILKTATKETLDTTYRFTLPNKQIISFIRPTSIDIKPSLADLDKSLSLFGTFSHEIFSKFLKIVLENKEDFNIDFLKKPDTFSKILNKYLFNVNLQKGKKNTAYYVYENNIKPITIDTAPGQKFGANTSQDEAQQYFNKKTLQKTTDYDKKKFTNAVIDVMLDLINKSNDEEKEKYMAVFGELSDAKIKALFMSQIKILHDILQYINTNESRNGYTTPITLDNLALFSEIFIHNYDGSKVTDLYGGTLDIVAIAPSGRKYIYDIKTRKESNVIEYRKSGYNAVREVENYYGVQQSIYRELFAVAVDDEPNNIISNLVYVPRMIVLKWSKPKADRFQNWLLNYRPDTAWKDFVKDINDTDLEKIMQNLLYVVEHTNVNKFADVTKQLLAFINTNLDIATNTLSKDIKAANILSQPDVAKYTNPTSATRLILSPYSKEKLNSFGIKITNDSLSNPIISELMSIQDLIKIQVYMLDDELLILNNKENLNPEEIRKKRQIQNAIKSYLLELNKINKIIKDVNNDITNNISNDVIKRKVFKELNINAFDVYTKNIKNKNRFYDASKSKTIFEDYIKQLGIIIDDINRTINVTRSSLTSNEETLKNYNAKLKVLRSNIENNKANVNSAELNKLISEYLALVNSIDIVKHNILNLKESVDYLNNEKNKLHNHLSVMKNTGSLNEIEHNAKATLIEINKLIVEIDNINIPAKNRITSYNFMNNAVKLYSQISNYISIQENTEDETELELLRLQNDFIKKIPIVEELRKKLIADVMTEYEMETDTAVLRKNIEEAKTDVKLINNKIQLYKELYQDYDSNIHKDLIDRIVSNENFISDNENRLIELLEESRETNLAKIAKDLSLKIDAMTFSLANETLLAATRSNYSLLQVYGILETDVNTTYANIYRDASDEIQEISAKFVYDYNRAETDNTLKFQGTGIPYDRFTAYDKLIARHIDPNFVDINTAIKYLTDIAESATETFDGDNTKTYKYMLVFTEEDKQKVKGMNIAQVSNYIRNNPSIIDKYKVVKTLTLIDRVRYNFIKMFPSVSKNKYDRQPGKVKDEVILGDILNLFQTKFNKNNDNMYTYDTRRAFFKDYLLFIQELIGIYNTINQGTDTYQSISNALFSKDLNTWITNVLNDNIDISKLSKSKIYDKLIYDIINDLGTSFNGIDDLSNKLRNKLYDEIKSYYGSNYGEIFILKGIQKYQDYSKVDGYKYRGYDIGESIVKSNISKNISSYKNTLEKSTDITESEEKTLTLAILSLLHFTDGKEELEEFIKDNDNRKQLYDEFLKSNPINIVDIYIQNSKLKSLIKSNPFLYTGIAKLVSDETNDLVSKQIVSINDEDVEIIKVNHFNPTTIDIKNILRYYNISDFMPLVITSDKKHTVTHNEKHTTINSVGYRSTFENGTTKHFDSAWDEFESNDVLFKYYKYVRNSLEHLYSIVPSDQLYGTTKLDLPFLEDSSVMKYIEQIIKDKKISANNRKAITNYLKEEFASSTTNALQDTDVKPPLTVKPIKFHTIEELRDYSSKADYQIDHLLQIFAYNALLNKERLDKFPISKIILDLVEETAGIDPMLISGARFNHIVNNTGIPPISIDKDTNSYLTPSEQQQVNLYTFNINKLTSEKKNLETQIEILNSKFRNEDGSFKNINIEESRNYQLMSQQLKDKLIVIDYKINSFKKNIERLNNSRKLSKEAIVRLWINSARKVQLTYSLTGQFGNLMNGLIQTSIVASGSKLEMDAYIKSLDILNDMMVSDKTLMGTAYAGNIVTSAIAGNLAGALSIPMWMLLANSMIDKMKNNAWLASKFNDNVKKAINMELNYNVTFDIVEQARANKPETNYYKANANGEIVKNENEFIQLMSPYGFVKRAEKLIVVQNMLIQSFVTKIKIPGIEQELTWWDIHDTDGKIKSEYAPYISENMIKNWTRKLSDRLHKANGNYTSKVQGELNWFGKLLLVYAKWIPETMRNYIGGYTPKEKDLYSESAHEGILVSAYKEGVEQYYKLIHNQVIKDFPIERKIIPINYDENSRAYKLFKKIGNSFYDSIIVYENGSIIWNNINKLNFAEAYNALVEDDTVDDEQFLKEATELVKKYNIRVFKAMTDTEKKSFLKRMKDIFVSFLTPFDIGKSVKDKTITRNVADRLTNIFGEDDDTRQGYDQVHHANLRRFYNFTHLMYSMFFTKTMLLIMFGYLTKVLDFDKDDDSIKNMKFIINRYNQLWKDVTYYSNPVSAFYKFFTGGLSTVKFAMDLAQLNIDIVATMPHLVNALAGDSEMGDVLLESLGFRDPIIDKSSGITTVRPVNDFIDMIPLLNKMSSIYKQSMNDYTNMN